MTNRLARRSNLFRAFAVSFTLALAACGTDAPPPELAIRNVTVIDAVNGVREGQTVSVNEGLIVGVGAEVDGTHAVEVVDGTGKYLIPGLWDFHVHLTYDEQLTQAMPGLFLRYGITSVRDTGGLLEKLLPIIESMRAEGATAPRVFFSGPLMDGEHVVYDGENRPGLGISNPDIEAVQTNVAGLVEAGVDFLKIYAMVSPEVFEALVEAAQTHGLPIAGHVPLSLTAREVGPLVQALEHFRNFEMDCVAGADSLLAERLRILAEPLDGSAADLRSRLHSLQRLPAVAAYDADRCAETLASMASTIQVPTLRLNTLTLQPPFDRPDWDAALANLPQTVSETWGADTEAYRAAPPSADTVYAAWSLFLTGLAHEAGVPIGAGTDTPISYSVPGYSLHSELEMLVQAGLSPMEALHSATVRPAEFFGLSAEMGMVEEGRLADLVLLSGDPLVDIANTRTVQAVVSKGKLLTSEELAALVR